MLKTVNLQVKHEKLYNIKVIYDILKYRKELTAATGVRLNINTTIRCSGL